MLFHVQPDNVAEWGMDGMHGVGWPGFRLERGTVNVAGCPDGAVLSKLNQSTQGGAQCPVMGPGLRAAAVGSHRSVPTLREAVPGFQIKEKLTGGHSAGLHASGVIGSPQRMMPGLRIWARRPPLWTRPRRVSGKAILAR